MKTHHRLASYRPVLTLAYLSLLKATLVVHPISDSACEPRGLDHRLDSHCGGARQAELVGDSGDRAGGQSNRAQVSGLGGLEASARVWHVAL